MFLFIIHDNSISHFTYQIMFLVLVNAWSRTDW